MQYVLPGRSYVAFSLAVLCPDYSQFFLRGCTELWKSIWKMGRMTIIAIHHTDTEIIALADGLISNQPPARVLEEDQKIIMFRPVYRIPRISMSRFNGFDEYVSGDFCVAYAGTFSLAATIVKRFLDVVTQRLAIDRDDNGTPFVCRRADQYGHFRSLQYDDSFNFDTKELWPITVNFLVNILQNVADKACHDFYRNAMKKPDVRFVLFGQDQVNTLKRKYRVQVLRCLDIQNGELVFERYSAMPWALTLEGDSSVFSTLRHAIETDPSFAQAPEASTRAEESGSSDRTIWMEAESRRASYCANRERIVKKEVLSLIHSGTNTIGGDCSIALASWARPLRLKSIKSQDIASHLS